MSKPFTTVLDEAFADYKLHHKDLDYCFNDAVAVHHVQQTILSAVEQLLTEVIGEDAPKEVCKSCKDAYFDNTGRKFNEKYASLPCHHSDATTQTKATQRQRLAALLKGNKA